jgi:hypothetical protein
MVWQWMRNRTGVRYDHLCEAGGAGQAVADACPGGGAGDDPPCLQRGCGVHVGLSAQPAVRVVKKIVDAYTALHAGIRAGNLGSERSRRRVKAESKPITFSALAAQPFDDRCLSWRHDAGTVSIWTMAGRLKGIGFVGSADQLARLRAHRRGESDLLFRDGMWFLIATCEVSEPQTRRTPSQADEISDRRLKKRARKEARHAACVNHGIAKDIVAVAQRTGRGMAPASHPVLVAVPSARAPHHLQGPPRRGAGPAGGRPLHLADVSEVQAHVPLQPSHQGLVLLSSVWSRWTRRRRRRREHS